MSSVSPEPPLRRGDPRPQRTGDHRDLRRRARQPGARRTVEAARAARVIDSTGPRHARSAGKARFRRQDARSDASFSNDSRDRGFTDMHICA